MSDDTLYKVYAYPKKGYVNDEPLQARLTARSKHHDKRLMVLFFSFIAVFIFCVTMAFIGFAFFALLAIAYGFLLPTLGFFYLRTPKCSCSSCGKRMKREASEISDKWFAIGIFLICEDCQRYVDTHKRLK